eukprot:1141538-Pelagomonas_calceolata.AAC.1
MQDLCGVPCLLRNTWCEQGEEEGEEEVGLAWDLKVVLYQPIITSNVRVNQACSQRALLRALMIILPATLWRS